MSQGKQVNKGQVERKSDLMTNYSTLQVRFSVKSSKNMFLLVTLLLPPLSSFVPPPSFLTIKYRRMTSSAFKDTVRRYDSRNAHASANTHMVCDIYTRKQAALPVEVPGPSKPATYLQEALTGNWDPIRYAA